MSSVLRLSALGLLMLRVEASIYCWRTQVKNKEKELRVCLPTLVPKVAYTLIWPIAALSNFTSPLEKVTSCGVRRDDGYNKYKNLHLGKTKGTRVQSKREGRLGEDPTFRFFQKVWQLYYIQLREISCLTEFLCGICWKKERCSRKRWTPWKT